MKAADLRIGNWILYQEKSYKVHLIGDGYVVPYKTWWSDVPERKIHGIPLTPEILEKSGCTLTEVQGVSIYILPGCDYGVYVDRIGDYQLCKKVTIIESPIYMCDVPFVHSLQNAHFALTNQELNIQL